MPSEYILLEELRSSKEEWKDLRTRQWTGFKYFTTILTSLLALFSGALTISFRGSETNTVLFLLGALISITIIIISIIAIRNLQRETHHLFETIALVYLLRKELKLCCENSILMHSSLKMMLCPTKTDRELIENNPKEWALEKAQILGVLDFEKNNHKQNRELKLSGNSVPHILVDSLRLLKQLISGKCRPTFMGIVVITFTMFMFLGISLLGILVLLMILN